MYTIKEASARTGVGAPLIQGARIRLAVPVTATATVAETITRIVTRAASVPGQGVDGVVERGDAVRAVPQR